MIKAISRDECFEKFSEFDFSFLTAENEIALVKLAVSVGHAFEQRFGTIPTWCFDKRLVLTEPYLGRGYNISWFLFGPQAFYRHNCFFDPGSLEVM